MYVRISFSLKRTFVKIENALNLISLTVWINSENTGRGKGVYKAQQLNQTHVFVCFFDTLQNFKIVKLRMKTGG